MSSHDYYDYYDYDEYFDNDDYYEPEYCFEPDEDGVVRLHTTRQELIEQHTDPHYTEIWLSLIHI